MEIGSWVVFIARRGKLSGMPDGPQKHIRVVARFTLVAALEACFRASWHDDFDVRLAEGQRLRLSRAFRERLLP